MKKIYRMYSKGRVLRFKRFSLQVSQTEALRYNTWREIQLKSKTKIPVLEHCLGAGKGFTLLKSDDIAHTLNLKSNKKVRRE